MATNNETPSQYDCLTSNDPTDCCHCYSAKYQNDRLMNDTFFKCPATFCVFESCIECLEGETERGNTYTCCNGPRDPPCHDCSCVFLPIALVLDIACFIPRCFGYEHGPVGKSCVKISNYCGKCSHNEEETEQ